MFAVTTPQNQGLAPTALPLSGNQQDSLNISATTTTTSAVRATHDSKQNQGWFKSLGSRLVKAIVPRRCSDLKTRAVTAVQNLGAAIKSVPASIHKGWVLLKDRTVRLAQSVLVIGKETATGVGVGGVVGTAAALTTTILCPPLSPTMPYTISLVAGTGAAIGFQRGLAEASLIWNGPPSYDLAMFKAP